MWSPEGYINWGEFQWLCWRAAKLRWPTPVGYIRPLKENGSKDWENDNHFKAIATNRWLTHCVLHGRHPVTSICSPSGQVLTASGQFFWRESYGYDNGHPASFALLSDVQGEHLAFAHFVGSAGFAHIDDSSGRILRPSFWKLGRLHCIKLFPRLGKKTNPSLEAQICNWHFARRFAGWAICFEKTEMFASGEAFLAGFTAIMSIPDDPMPTNQETLTSSGLEHAYECFRDAFPDGKVNATWPEVEARTGYSRRQIKRALDAFSGQDAGQHSGQDPT